MTTYKRLRRLMVLKRLPTDHEVNGKKINKDMFRSDKPIEELTAS